MKNTTKKLVPALAVLVSIIGGTGVSAADLKFVDIAKDASSGIEFARTPSVRDQIIDQFKQPGSFLTAQDVPMIPGGSRGIAGVGLFDYDNDGDLDIYVTNGPGTPNSLLQNQLAQTGQTRFVDVAAYAGVAAVKQDSSAVCFGDIDNDGDKDLYVTGTSEPNKLFINRGNGRFSDRTRRSKTGAGNRTAVGCSFGDVNGDGLLDLAVANVYDSLDNRLALMVPGFGNLKEHNQLFVNNGRNRFSDRSFESGLESFRGASWALSIIDYDRDGDQDIVVADDQGVLLPESVGGQDVGYIRLLNNDGTGHFTDVTDGSGTDVVGDWMGLAFGDLNGDGNIDIFSSNIGDYLGFAVGAGVGLPVGPGVWASRWFLGNEYGTFSDSKAGDLVTTPFGWGASIADFDNDNAQDIIFHGGADMGVLIDGTNPGALLRNDGHGNLAKVDNAFDPKVSHSRRLVRGVAVGDLDNDGRNDIVSVSAADWPEPFPIFPMLPPEFVVGSPFDSGAYIWPTFSPAGDMGPAGSFVWTGLEPANGSLAVELNRSNGLAPSTRIRLRGSKGTLPNGEVNRDGIGAIVTVKHKGNVSVLPVISGGSHASSDAIEKVVPRLGRYSHIDVLWPSGVSNRLYGSHSKSTLIPEIPCDYKKTQRFSRYARCVGKSLRKLRRKNVLNYYQTKRHLYSALRAYYEHKYY